MIVIIVNNDSCHNYNKVIKSNKNISSTVTITIIELYRQINE